MELNKALALALAISLILNVFTYTYMYIKLEEKDKAINELLNYTRYLSEENEKLKKEIIVLKKTIELLNTSYQHPYAGNVSLAGYGWIPIVGVYVRYVSFFEKELVGEVMWAYAKIVPGSGRVFVSTTPKIGIDLQRSAEIAYMVARNYVGVGNDFDVMLVIVANRSINVVDGPSAGAAITVLLISLLGNITIRKDVAITGTILSDGSIGPVGGVYEKALAAAKRNITLFLVPKGQSKIVKYIPVKKNIAPGVVLITYKSRTVSLEEELRSMGYNITVREVANITDALRYFTLKS